MSRVVWLGLLILFLGSCGDEETRPIFYYDSSEKLLSFTTDDIKQRFNLAGLTAFADEVKYDILVYKFYYKTEFNGEELIASGLLSLPVTSDPVPVVSIQHGTIVDHDSAPSVDWGNNAVYTYFSSAGYIMAIPDYIGFGSSESVLHPYYIAEAYQVAIRDMLKAAEEFAYLEGAVFNGDVFLAGYSEGGYATMAAARSLQEDPIPGFDLAASAPAAGGYDIKHFQEYFFSLETYPQPFFMAFVGASYDQYWFENSSLSDYFQEPYASQIPDLVSGDYDGNYINASLTQTVADFVQPDLLQNVDTDPKFAEMVDGFVQNSMSDWVPTHPMFLYHGTADNWVPYENSVVTYDKMKAAGASTDMVKFIPIEGEDHTGAALPYFLDVIQKFNELK